MRILNEHHSFTGMQRDMSISKHPTSFLYNARNIRLTSRGDSTLLAITNEKGTEDKGVYITGVYLGHCLINQFLVIFSTNPETSPKADYITKVDLDNIDIVETILYNGNLNFHSSNPIEAIGYFENNNIQKVYWTDGLNPPRMINIVDNRIEKRSAPDDNYPFTDNSFDFITKLSLNEEILINKQTSGEGMFSAGVIQYAFTYYNKYGQESNIFYTSPLLYISPLERGASPEEKVGNSFKIDVYKIDHNYDYLRIYSIQRTSLNGTPIVKRVCDINIPTTDKVVSYIDTGTQGDFIDPTELLYKGGEKIIAGTLEQKDNTLFFGNITLQRKSVQNIISKLALDENQTIEQYISEHLKVDTDSSSSGKRTLNVASAGNKTYRNYNYGNQLNSTTRHPDIVYGGITYANLPKSTSCAGFKYGDTYRCGIQFQHETGVWSEPIFIRDITELAQPNLTENANNIELKLPILLGKITPTLAEALREEDYVRMRAVVVYPTLQDRNVLCQGVACPTVKHHNQYQSSWFFRPRMKTDSSWDAGHLNIVLKSPASGDINDDLIYAEEGNGFNPTNLRKVEIQGSYSGDNKCVIDTSLLTLNSPDVEYDTDLQLFNWSTVNVKKLGEAEFITTVSDINIQTETPTISNNTEGFTYSEFLEWYNTIANPQGYGILSQGLIAGLYYEDWLLDDDGGSIVKLGAEQSPYKWFVYPWNRNGSLNNDIERPTGKGTRSALLKKKVMSNARYSHTTWLNTSVVSGYDYTLGIDNQPSPALFDSSEVALVMMGGLSYMGNIDKLLHADSEDGYYYMFGSDNRSAENIDTGINAPNFYWKVQKKNENNGMMMMWNNNEWTEKADLIGDTYINLASEKSYVRMKYKSSPHLIFKNGSTSVLPNDAEINSSTLPIIEFRQNVSSSTRFGGTSEDALKSNLWIPCGEPIRLDATPISFDNVLYIPFEYTYGDTYFQRWDCLKTYPFTTEDVNQIVEIGSFQLESHTNVDGRYDKNRGMISNLHMSSINFNLINPVYSQINNFFSYKILDKDYYNQDEYPNQIIWSKEKKPGAEIDLWTNITLASTYDMDGTKGAIESLNTWKDRLFCFQDKGVSNILFNSRVQIPTSDGIPIEISNSYKVDGYRYIGDGIGCRNKFLIKETPAGIYFIDSITKHLYHISDGMQDVTVTHNMASWFEKPDTSIERLLYDEVHKDLYITGNDTLCFSEVLGQFTSFMDYHMDLLESRDSKVFSLSNQTLYEMFVGPYNQLFENTVDWEFTFISNGIDNGTQDFDKVFSNIDYRMDVFDASNNTYLADDTLTAIRVTNEYQDTGEVSLSRLKDVSYSKSYHHKDTNLQKKFKIWRIQIPKDSTHRLDRIRNPWCKITLKSTVTGNKKSVLQDLNVQYYI